MDIGIDTDEPNDRCMGGILGVRHSFVNGAGVLTFRSASSGPQSRNFSGH